MTELYPIRSALYGYKVSKREYFAALDRNNNFAAFIWREAVTRGRERVRRELRALRSFRAQVRCYP